MNPARPDEPAADAATAPGVPRRLVTPRQYLWVAGALAVVSLALHFLGPAITPFLIGAIFAYLGTPLVGAMARRRVPRTLGTVLTVLLFGVAVFAILLVLVPLVQAEVGLAAKKLPELFARLWLTCRPGCSRTSA